jgi:hypothetical protein
MKRISMVALCLAAVFAFGATSAMASTVPTYKTCIKAAKVGKEYTGNYTEKACATKSAPGKGEYELASYKSAKKLGFKSKSGKSTLYSYIPGVGVAGTVVCAKDKGVGTVTGERTAESVVTFEKCESSGFKCTSTGAKAGDIVTNPLNEELVWINEGKDEVGDVVEAVSHGASASFNCEGHLKVTTVGSLVGVQTGDINTVSKSENLAFSVNSPAKGEQVPAEAEGTPHSLYSEIESEAFTGTLPSGEETADEVKGEALGVFPS